MATRRRRTLAIGVLLALVLGLLAAGLRDFEFRPGTMEIGEPVAARPGADAGGGLRIPGLHWLFVALTVLGAAGTVMGLLVSREIRRELVLRLLTAAVVAAVLLGIGLAITSPTPPTEELEDTPTQAHPGIAAPEIPIAGVESEVSPAGAVPYWAPYLLSAMAALAAGALVLYILGRRGSRPRRSTTASLADSATEALDALRRGVAVTEVVQRCWLQMSSVLSTKAAVANAQEMTAREFAALLRSRGYRDEAVDRLTRLFEEVRYGRKESEPRRADAIAALSAIQEHFGGA